MAFHHRASDDEPDGRAGNYVAGEVAVLLDARDADQPGRAVGERLLPPRIVMARDHGRDRERLRRVTRGK